MQGYVINGRIMTMAEEKAEKKKEKTRAEYENGFLHIENGKIVGIGDMEELETLPSKDAGIDVIDAGGRLVMPGIIEAHCHMGITEEKKGMEGDDCNENVQPITPYLRALDAIHSMDAAFDDAVRAGITSAMIGPGSSNVVGGQFAFVKTKGRRIDDLIVLPPAAMKIAFGENPKVNFSGQGKMPVTRMAVAGMLREELFRAKQYVEKRKKAGEEFEKDFHYECWVPVFEGKIPFAFYAIVNPVPTDMDLKIILARKIHIM